MFENDSTPQLYGSRGIIVINDILNNALIGPSQEVKTKTERVTHP